MLAWTDVRYLVANYTVCGESVGERVVLLLLLNSRERQYNTTYWQAASIPWCRRRSGRRRRWRVGGRRLRDRALPRSTRPYSRTGRERPPCILPHAHIHAHTHPFNGFFSGTARVGRYQKGKTNLDFTEARDSEWQWHQLGSMQVCTLLQTDNHASTPPLRFLQAGCPSCRPTNSVKALKAKHAHRQTLHKKHVAIRHANTPVQASTDREHGP